jgi:hypothetical protein
LIMLLLHQKTLMFFSLRVTKWNIFVSRVARFFSVKHPKTWKIYLMTLKCTKWPQNVPNGHKIYHLAVK